MCPEDYPTLRKRKLAGGNIFVNWVDTETVYMCVFPALLVALY